VSASGLDLLASKAERDCTRTVASCAFVCFLTRDRQHRDLHSFPTRRSSDLDFQAGRIDGYQAERRLSAEYKQHLKQKYKYVLDMPIRLKPGQRPKYRMIHVCDHEDGCFLMAENMQRRKDELFVNIQQNGQLS